MKTITYFAICLLTASVACAQPTFPTGSVHPYFLGVSAPVGYFPDPNYTNSGTHQVTYDSGYLNSPYVSNPASNTANVGAVMKFYPPPSGGSSTIKFLLTNSFAGPTNLVGAEFGLWAIGGNAIAITVRSTGGSVIVASNSAAQYGAGWKYLQANIPPTTNVVMEASLETIGWTVVIGSLAIGNLPVWVGGIRFNPDAPQTPNDPNFRIESDGTALVWNASRYPGYIVQESPSPAGAFTDVAGYTTSTNAGWITAGITATGEARFFRLRSP